MRHRRLSSALIVLVSFGVLAWGFWPLVGCRVNPETGETEIHWPSVALELELVGSDLRDAAMLSDDPTMTQNLTDIATVAEQVAAAVKDGPPDADGLALIDAALLHVEAVWEAVSGDQAPADVRVAVLLIRSTLRRVRAHALPQPTSGV